MGIGAASRPDAHQRAAVRLGSCFAAGFGAFACDGALSHPPGGAVTLTASSG
jgi:hypothetical protein